VLHGEAADAAAAVRRAAAHTGLVDHLDEAAADVARAIAALQTAGLPTRAGPDLRVEYALAGPGPDGTLLAGYADLVAATAGAVIVLDFKTDEPRPGDAEHAFPEYATQVRTYARLLGPVARGSAVRAGLLFTKDGSVKWVR
jgi:ATP-dependent helicase/nuclease subunit A